MVFLAALPLVTAPPSNLTRLYYNGSAAKSHSTTTQYRQLRKLVVSKLDILETDCKRCPLFNFADFGRVNCAVKFVDHRSSEKLLKRALSVLDVVSCSFDNISGYIY